MFRTAQRPSSFPMDLPKNFEMLGITQTLLYRQAQGYRVDELTVLSVLGKSGIETVSYDGDSSNIPLLEAAGINGSLAAYYKYCADQAQIIAKPYDNFKIKTGHMVKFKFDYEDPNAVFSRVHILGPQDCSLANALLSLIPKAKRPEENIIVSNASALGVALLNQANGAIVRWGIGNDTFTGMVARGKYAIRASSLFDISIPNQI